MIRETFLPFSRPSITEADVAAVAGVLRSGWITTGARNACLEERFRAYTGGGDAASVSSATGGMHLVLAALGIGPGDEVVTPAMTWVSTVNLIVLAGAVPVFADVDPDTLMVTADTVQRAVTARTRLIIPVHFAGAPADMTPLRKIAEESGAALVEDAAHAAGTAYRHERIGRRGTAVFSFHPIKNMTTGEGGMVVSDDAGLMERIRRLRFHGLGVDAYDRASQGRAPQAEVMAPGYKYNLPDILAVLGCGQLDRLDDMNRRREALAGHYLARLTEIDEVLPLAAPPYPHDHAWHLFIVRLDVEKAGMTRDAFMAGLKERNIGTGLHFRAVHQQQYYRKTLNVPPGLLVNTEWNSERICSLPLFPDMAEEDVDDVIDAIKDVLSNG